MKANITLDALGLLCPLPVLKAQKTLKSMGPGDILALIADDPAAQIDVPHFCNESGHTLVESEASEQRHTYFIQHK